MEDSEHGASLAQIVNAETALDKLECRLHAWKTKRPACAWLSKACKKRWTNVIETSTLSQLIWRNGPLELADLSLSHKKLTALYVATMRSTSWRITAPLRWLGKVVQPMLGTTQQSPAAAHRAPTIDPANRRSFYAHHAKQSRHGLISSGTTVSVGNVRES